MAYFIEPMGLDDVDEVSRVERECFLTPWPTNAYRREIRENRMGCYVVLRWLTDRNEPTDDTAESRVRPDVGRHGVLRVVGNLLRPFGLAERVELQRHGEIVGFAGMWLMFDEAHITTIGVQPAFRGLGLGEFVLQHLIVVARDRGARRVTLEVRVTNTVAQALYRKYSFREEGVRKRYYSDNGEDALIMWSDRIDDPSFEANLAQRRAELARRVATLPSPAVVRLRAGANGSSSH